MQYVLVIVFIVVHAAWGLELGYTDLSPGYTHFTFMFQHASWLHLLLNSLVLVSVYRVLKRFID